MTTAITKPNSTAAVAERALIQGDLSGLSEAERLAYYKQVCESVGLNPLTQPFAYIKLSGKLTLYARKDAADQLRKNHNISIRIVGRQDVDGVYEVTARASTPDGREDEDVGAVTVKGLQGDALANARMKATTKAKRRVTLSICGLGFLDESELETIAEVKAQSPAPKQIAQEKATPPQLEAIADLAHKCEFQDKKELAEFLQENLNIKMGSKLSVGKADEVIALLRHLAEDVAAKRAEETREPGEDDAAGEE